MPGAESVSVQGAALRSSGRWRDPRTDGITDGGASTMGTTASRDIATNQLGEEAFESPERRNWCVGAFHHHDIGARLMRQLHAFFQAVSRACILWLCSQNSPANRKRRAGRDRHRRRNDTLSQQRSARSVKGCR